MSINGISHNGQEPIGVYAGRKEPAGGPDPGRGDEQQQKQNKIGPAYLVEQSEGIQKPFIYHIQKDEQGNMKILFGKSDPQKTNDEFLEKVYHAFSKTDLSSGTYSIQKDQKGNLLIEKAEDHDAVKDVKSEKNDKKASEKSKEKADKTEKMSKEDDDDDGSEWMIMELEPDPEDPHNPYKAKRRIVAQGKGRLPGVDAGKFPRLPKGAPKAQ